MALRFPLVAAALVAIPLALIGALLPDAALAASDRPPAPVILSPVAGAFDQGAGELVVSGTGTVNDTVYVNVFATMAAFTAGSARNEFYYQQWKSGNASGFGGPPGAIVGGDGHWTYTLKASDFTGNVHDGVTYIAADEVNGNPVSGPFYPISSYSPVVRILTARPAASVTAGGHVTTRPRAGSASAPSVFSNLVAFHWATFTPAHFALTAGMALVLTLLLGFPTTLLNSALEQTYDERSRRLKPVADRLSRTLGRVRTGWMRVVDRIPKLVKTALWFLLAAIVSGFADPSFGFNPESLRLLVSLFAAFTLLNVLGAYVTWWLTARSSHTQRPTFPARPSNLLILVVTVLVARLIHLEPTLVFGGVLGLDFGVKLAATAKVRVTLVGAGYAAVIGLAGWIAYSTIPATAIGFGPVLLREFCSQLAVAGLATLPVSLLPFRALSGDSLFEWRRIGWAVAYALGLVVFLVVLLPMPFSWSGVTEPLVAWVALFVAYSVIATIVWVAVRFRWFRPRASA